MGAVTENASDGLDPVSTDNMDIGIGLPNTVLGVDKAGIVDFARAAEDAGFTSLGTIDRVAYGNYESLIALAAAAAVTERIRLVTDILIAPLRSNAALFAKQAATLDHLSGGRLVLGLAPGGRPDDYELSGVDFSRRGRLFDRQLEELAGFWRGEGGVGPAPARGARPALLIGGRSDAAFRRVVQHADGWTSGGGGVEPYVQGAEQARAAWRAAGREGEPRTMSLLYFSLGPRAAEQAQASLGAYYAFAGEYAEHVVADAATDEAALRNELEAYERAGCDEVICFPASADPAQVELLARAIA
jgi:alkanesulfonate monooxygenase SsuD/methylene tetrahydromethanopterin reductase-like flavin-dependent oxidoreductase (luciferase family)